MWLDDLLEQNRRWAAEQVADDPAYFSRHVGGQDPRLLWIGCSDSRVPAEQILGCGPGELFIHRNVANVVAYNDVNIASVIQYAVERLLVEDIVICGHYDCGGVAAACSDDLGEGYVADWLMITSWARRWVDERLAREGISLSRADYLRAVVDENVRLQVKHLTHLTMIRKSWKVRAGLPRLHGWTYDISTGLIKVIMDIVDGLPDEAP